MLLIHRGAQPRQLRERFAIAAAALAQMFGKLANGRDVGGKVEFFLGCARPSA